MQKTAFFDLDNTLFNGNSMQAFLFGFLIPQRKIAVKPLLSALILVVRYKFHLISHNEASIQNLYISAQILKGKTVKEVNEWKEDFFSVEQMFPHIPKLFALLENNGYEISIISASIEPIVTACADVFGVKSYASTMGVKDGKYTGEISCLMNQGEKAKVVNKLLGDSVGKVSSIAFGDSSGDLAMLRAVDHGFLFKPFEEDMIEVAKSEGITIVNGDTIYDNVGKVLV